jgi:hypothetical protein
MSTTRTPRSADKIRSLNDNKAQWPILKAFSKHLQWPIEGELQWIDDKSFKHILTAGFIKYMKSLGPEEAWMVARYEVQTLAAGFDLHSHNCYDQRGTVMMGYKTREFDEKLWPYWMEFLNAAATNCGVKVPVSKKQAAQYENKNNES